VGVDGAEPMGKPWENPGKTMGKWENHRKTIRKWWLYPLVNVYIAMENHHFNGTTHYKWSFSIAMLVYERVMIA